jgi:hypothetical protein
MKTGSAVVAKVAMETIIWLTREMMKVDARQLPPKSVQICR